MSSKCSNEFCWTKQSFLKKTSTENKEIVKENFLPSRPKEWKQNPREWLDTNNIVFLGITLGSYEVLFIICAFIILVSMNAFILIKEEGAMGVITFLRQLIFSRRQIL